MCVEHYLQALAKVPHDEGIKFENEYADPCWGSTVNLAVRTLHMYGIIYKERVVDSLRPSLDAEYRQLLIKFLSVTDPEKVDITKLKTHEELIILLTLDCSEYPLQLALSRGVESNARCKKWLESFSEFSAVHTYNLYEIFGIGSRPNFTLTKLQWACFENDLRKHLGAIRKLKTGGIQRLSLMDLLEEWAQGNAGREQLFTNLKNVFKLSQPKERFKPLHPPQEEWISNVAKKIKPSPHIYLGEILDRRSSDAVRSRQHSISLSTSTSPRAAEGEKKENPSTDKICFSRVGSQGREVILEAKDDFQEYVVVSTVEELKEHHLQLTEKGWEMFQSLISREENAHRIVTTLYLEICMHDLFAPTCKKPLKDCWKPLLDTLHRIIPLDIQGNIPRLRQLLEAGLLFTFCSKMIEPRWGKNFNEGTEEIFQWMQSCTISQKEKIFSKLVELQQAAAREPEDLSAFTAWQLCKELHQKNQMEFEDLICLWLHLQRATLRKKIIPPVGEWLDFNGTRNFIRSVETFCRIPLPSKTIYFLLTGHPINRAVAQKFEDLSSDYRKQILTCPYPFLPYVHIITLIGSREAQARGFLQRFQSELIPESFSKESEANRIFSDLAGAIQNATLLGNGYVSALKKFPPLLKDHKNADCAWLLPLIPFGQKVAKSAYCICAWQIASEGEDKYYQFSITVFHSLEYGRARTIMRTLRIPPERFQKWERLRHLFVDFITKLTPEEVNHTYRENSWPNRISYDDPELMEITLSNLNDNELTDHVNSFKNHYSQAKDDAIELFRFCVATKVQLRSLFDDEPTVINRPGVPPLKEILKGHLEVLPKQEGWVLATSAFPAEGDAYKIRRADFVNGIMQLRHILKKDLNQIIQFEMEVKAPYSTIDFIPLCIAFSVQKTAEGQIMYVAEVSFTKLEVLFTEKLCLPSTLTSKEMEECAYFVLCRIKRHYYQHLKPQPLNK